MALEVPRYFSAERLQTVTERNEKIQTILNRWRSSRAEIQTVDSVDENSVSSSISFSVAVRTLQAHERARQGRLHAFSMQRIKQKVNDSQRKIDLNEFCLVIQTVWRQKNAEKRFKQMKINEQKLLGMVRIAWIRFELCFSFSREDFSRQNWN